MPLSFRLDKYQPPRGLKKGDVVNVKFRIYGSKTLDKPARAFHMTAASMIASSICLGVVFGVRYGKGS